MNLRRITGVAFVATMTAVFVSQPSQQMVSGNPALIGWAAAHFFGGSPDVGAAVGAGAAGTDITNYAKDNMTEWFQDNVTPGMSEMAGSAGESIDALAIGMAELDPVVVLAAADAGAAITGLGAAEAGAAVGAEVGTAVAPVVGTIVGALVGGL